MDQSKYSISPHDLYARLVSDTAPIVVDVRRDDDFANTDRLVVPAFHRSPDEVERWREDLPSGRPVVAYCFHGHEVSQGVASALRIMGVDANFLEGGIAGWTEQGLPTRCNIGATPSKWVAREHPKIDRIAFPWLIRRFIDPNAEFPDDHEMLKHGMVIYDALYTWCRTLQAETHNWRSVAVGS
jgi:rhodanese-related sulfurtransferase